MLGFGKTTLLGDWLSHLEPLPQEIRVAWISLDEGDNDLPRLLAHLIVALRGAGIEVEPDSWQPGQGTSTSVALSVIVNDVARAAAAAPGAHWVVALDDYHVISAADVHEAVSFLLDHTPPQLHLLMATRSDPPLPLPRLRSRGELTEVRAADLRFTPTEAQEFLNTAMGLDLSTADVEALEERTEGWIAGLQLAALSLRGMAERDEVADFIEAFTGSNRFVIDYLAEEVLARQPVAVRDFLMSTAILERLSGSLCDAVTGSDDASRTLEDLERGNLFIVPLDDQRSWYRYHHLFAEVLRARLLAEHPDQVPELHRRASDWYAAHDLSIDAVRHALASEDFDRAAHLMEAAIPQMRRTRQDQVLLSWVKALLDSVVRRSPVLSIVSGWSHLMSGRLDALESRLDDAAKALAAGEQDPKLARAWALTEDLRAAPATISVYRASLAQAVATCPAPCTTPSRHWTLPDPRTTSSAGQEAGTSVSPPGLPEHHRGAGHLRSGRPQPACRGQPGRRAGRHGRARRHVGRRGSTNPGPPALRARPAHRHVKWWGITSSGGGRPARRAGRARPGAGRPPGRGGDLETARTLAERASISENRYRWYVAMAQVRVAARDFDSALHLLDDAATLFRPGFYPDVRPIAAMRARVQIAQEDLSAAEDWAREHGVPTAEETSYLREYDLLTHVRLLLARHRQLDRAAALLDRLQDHVEPSRAGSVIEIGMLRALTHDAHGDRPRALHALGRALDQAPEAEAYVRLFLDEGSPMLTLLHEADRRGTTEHHALSQHARRLLGAAGTSTQSAQQTAQDVLPDPLSDRELDVLRLLASELTGPQIARELYVSLNTLRTHTKHIFTKLDVNTRTAAVRRAHERGIL